MFLESQKSAMSQDVSVLVFGPLMSLLAFERSYIEDVNAVSSLTGKQKMTFKVFHTALLISYMIPSCMHSLQMKSNKPFPA